MLLERELELDAIQTAVATVTGGRGRILALEGPAGIGKSALLRAAEALARDAGLLALTARGTELEQEFGFGVARQLFEPAASVPHDFEGAARYAAALLDVELPEPAPLPLGPEGAAVVLHGLSRLLATLARRRPVAFLIDDGHWADVASLRFLAYLANRLERLPVLVVVAARPAGEPGGAAIGDMLSERCTTGVLRPCALSRDGSERIVSAAVPGAPATLCAVCHELTGGNPFFVRELAGALRDGGPAALDAAPRGVVASVRARLARFPAAAQRLAGAAAILGEGALIRHAAALADLRSAEAAEAADALRAGRDPGRHPRAGLRPSDHPQRGRRAALAGRSFGRATDALPGCSPRRTPRPSASPLTCSRPSRAGPTGPVIDSAPPRTRPCLEVRRPRRSRTCGGRSRSHHHRPRGLLCCSSSAWPNRLRSTAVRRSSTCGAGSRRPRTRSRGCTPPGRWRPWSGWTIRWTACGSSSGRWPPARTPIPR